MSVSLVIGNIFALLSVIFIFISVVKKNKTDLIGWQIANISFCIFSNIALFAYSALATNCVALLRNMLAYRKKLTLKATVILSIACVIAGLYVNNRGIFGWTVIAGTTSYTIFMYLAKNAQQMRYALIFSSILWIVHDFYVQSYPTVISGCFLIAWTIIQILKYRKLHFHHKYKVFLKKA